MDDRPDDTLRTAGLQDVARHLATTAGNTAAVAPTVDAYETFGLYPVTVVAEGR